MSRVPTPVEITPQRLNWLAGVTGFELGKAKLIGAAVPLGRDPFDARYGARPSIRYCRDHSVGASRRRATPIPRGRRPSTAALTRSGARKASEIVRLT